MLDHRIGVDHDRHDLVRPGLTGLGVVGLHLIADLEAADGLAASGGGDLRI
jgi:hypothetical protein